MDEFYRRIKCNSIFSKRKMLHTRDGYESKRSCTNLIVVNEKIGYVHADDMKVIEGLENIITI